MEGQQVWEKLRDVLVNERESMLESAFLEAVGGVPVWMIVSELEGERERDERERF